MAELEEINITDIIPSEYNPRRISEEEYEKLSKSLNSFGVVDPIIINLKNKHIIGGHQRYDVLHEQYIQDNNKYETLHLLRLGDIGWVFPDTELKVKSDDHEKALNLALNKISGEWDEPKLKPLLEDLSLKGFDIELTGFDEPELKELDINSPTPQDTAIEDDDYVPEEDMDVKVKVGDVYLLGRHRLMCGDSSNKDNIDILIEEDHIDLILTDPPYGINIVTSQNTVGTKSQVGFNKKERLLDNNHGVLGGGIVEPRIYKKIINDDKPFNPELLLEINTDSIIWGANNFSSKLPDSPRWLVWYKQPEEGNDNTFSDVELAWTNIKGKQCKLYKHLWSGLLREGDRKVELKERVHPTQKPVGLLTQILKDFSNTGNNILDLYGGSGSTLIACEQTDRNCYMMEIDPYYCQVIINRWEEFTGEKAVKIS